MNERGQVLIEWAMIVVLVALVGLSTLKIVYGVVLGSEVATCRNMACPDSYAISGDCKKGSPPPICAAP